MSTVPESIRRKILSIAMDFIHTENLEFNDNFPVKIGHIYSSLVEEKLELPDQESFVREANKMKTTFFRLNRNIIKRDFLKNLLLELNQEIKPFLEDILRRKPSATVPIGLSLCEPIYVDDIDSFKKVKKVTLKDVRDIVPLAISEKNIKRLLANIIGEKFVRKDWPGEKSDLYSSHVILRGNRIATAFLLKGPSVKRLTIDKCGKRGNQLLRMIKEPAQLFVVQHIGEIDTDVIELLERLVSDLSRKKSTKLYYCIIDGVDTARVLKAYNKL